MERGKMEPKTRKLPSGYGEFHHPKKWPILRFFTREKTWVNPVETMFRVTFQKKIFDFEIPLFLWQATSTIYSTRFYVKNHPGKQNFSPAYRASHEALESKEPWKLVTWLGFRHPPESCRSPLGVGKEVNIVFPHAVTFSWLIRRL